MRIKPLKTVVRITERGDSLQLISNSEAGLEFLIRELSYADNVLTTYSDDTSYVMMATPLKGLTNRDIIHHLIEAARSEYTHLNLAFGGCL